MAFLSPSIASIRPLPAIIDPFSSTYPDNRSSLWASGWLNIVIKCVIWNWPQLAAILFVFVGNRFHHHPPSGGDGLILSVQR